MHGVVYVAFGIPARREATASIGSLWQHNDLPVTVICDSPLDVQGCRYVHVDGADLDPGARWAKLNADKLAPKAWARFLYLDADTRIHGSLSDGFEMLDDGWDVAMAHSEHQEGDDLMWHIGAREQMATLHDLCNPYPLALQAGVMFVNRNERTALLFQAWRDEWLRWGGPDQAALLRALQRVPVRTWMLGRPWNGGAVVRHRFGMAKSEEARRWARQHAA